MAMIPEPTATSKISSASLTIVAALLFVTAACLMSVAVDRRSPGGAPAPEIGAWSLRGTLHGAMRPVPPATDPPHAAKDPDFA